jgi:molybdopterin-containing oxidoreductase family iron-sulfur binding subunit
MSFDELDETPAPREAAGREFPQELPVGEAAGESAGESRRDFFKIMGLSATAAMAACQRAPVENILPLTKRPDEMIPGVALWYATLCGGCPARCGLLVKTRDGRPIKVEGNPAHPVSRGAVCAVGQASLLGLYDADRARGPRVAGKKASWKEVDAAVDFALANADRAGKAIRFVVPWNLGPTTEAALDAFLARHRTARVVRFDPLGVRDALATACEALWGIRAVPDYRLDRADLVVSFEADFLGTWLAPAVFTRQWAGRREPGAAMQRVVQLESWLSLTGGSADERRLMGPGTSLAAVARLVKTLSEGRSDALAVRAQALLGALPALATTWSGPNLDDLADELRRAGKRGLVLAGSEDPAVQLLALAANALLANEETTAVIDASRAGRADELELAALTAELAAGQVGALFLLGVNPALARPGFAAALAKATFSLSTAERRDETAALTTVHAPEGHVLEGWSDDRPRAGVEVVAQPCVSPLFDTRPRLRSIHAWTHDAGTVIAGNEDLLAVKARFQKDVVASAPGAWEAAVREGVHLTHVAPPAPVAAAGGDRALALARGAVVASPGSLSLVLHPSVALFDGTGSTPNNGWLQELPDPITKVVWGNVAAVSPVTAAALELQDGDVVELATADGALRLPVLRQPGLSEKVVAVALGHGRASAGRNAGGHGANAWSLVPITDDGSLRLTGTPVTVKATGKKVELALCQTHASQEGRGLVRQAELAAYRDDPHAGTVEGDREAPQGHASAGGDEKVRKGLGLWPGHRYEGHRWGLAIDLNKCTGCAACVVSCSAENNVPVVGAEEARRRREMHWIRIDRYFADSGVENPDVLHQPMMCQHCENAPCETVCPVVATVHSSEGLNQQIYNRCVGTRYCANNCPTKVRRFNWFDYEHGGPLERMVLNPDVVVRTRGVMEKCSMCVHRIEEGRAASRREGRTLADGDVQTACQQSCPADAIVFGDANDATSALSRLRETPRSYRILEEINVKPQVTFLTRIKNRGDHG